jgi:hypothetical protein
MLIRVLPDSGVYEHIYPREFECLFDLVEVDERLPKNVPESAVCKCLRFRS